MTNNEYLALAETALARIEYAVDVHDIEIDCERSGHVLTLEFDTGDKIILNLQVPLQEIWLAGKMGAFHYRYQEGVWQDTRNGKDLFDNLSQSIFEHSGLILPGL